MAQLKDSTVNGNLKVTGDLYIGPSEINLGEKLNDISMLSVISLYDFKLKYPNHGIPSGFNYGTVIIRGLRDQEIL